MHIVGYQTTVVANSLVTLSPIGATSLPPMRYPNQYFFPGFGSRVSEISSDRIRLCCRIRRPTFCTVRRFSYAVNRAPSKLKTAVCGLAHSSLRTVVFFIQIHLCPPVVSRVDQFSLQVPARSHSYRTFLCIRLTVVDHRQYLFSLSAIDHLNHCQSAFQYSRRNSFFMFNHFIIIRRQNRILRSFSKRPM